jgi:putative aldouronate transport system permease protein
MATALPAGATTTVVEGSRTPSRGRSRGTIAIGLVLLVLALLELFPFYNLVMVSFGTPPGSILPTGFTVQAYSYILEQGQVLRAFMVSLAVTVVGTLLNVVLTVCTAWALSRRYLPGRRIMLGLIVFTMLFSGGLIPWYVVIKDLGLINNYAVMILPWAMNAFYMIIMLAFFRNFPESLEEAARMDGANDLVILTRVVIPTSTPVIAAIGLFYAVDRWNDWWTPLLFITDPDKWPLQLFTKQLLTNASQLLQQANGGSGASGILQGQMPVLPEALQMAVIVIGMVPIMVVYPFIQKYFAKGVMIGSIKG